MEIIAINIGNRSYKISCAAGEENKINKLAAKLNQRYKKLETNLGNKASADMILVIIGLMLEDEVATNNLADSKELKNENKSKIKDISTRIDGIIENLTDLQ